MAMKVTLAEFMGVSEEWLAGYEAAKAEEHTCEGCKYEFYDPQSICDICAHRYSDRYEPIAKAVE